MKLFKKAVQLTQYLSSQEKKGATIAFIPTMGALHNGHLSLINAAAGSNAFTVCSIFINPTQFNNADDFAKYPVTLEQDIKHLLSVNCDVLFLPTNEEIYPENYTAPVYDLGYIENVLEGVHRPGHFQGVSQVVHRLLELVQPTRLYLGAKDFQQVKIIERLLETVSLNKSVQVIKQPTLREADGLAMSSRNLRLIPAQRAKAPILHQVLEQTEKKFSPADIARIEEETKAFLAEQGFRVDYFTLADAETLLPPTPETTNYIALVAAYLGDVRLIDNLELTATN